MSSTTANVIGIIQEKVTPSEKVKNVLLNVALYQEANPPEDKILALIEHDASFALFVFVSERRIPANISDLSITKIIPINEHFSCDTNHIPNLLTVRSSNLTLQFLIDLEGPNRDFVDHVHYVIENFNKADHDWLRKFNVDPDNAEESWQQTTNFPYSRQKIARGHVSSGRDNLFRFEMESRKAQYTMHREFSIFVGTWNVNGQPPSITLEKWLACDEEAPLVYAIGFQELDLSKEAFLFNDSPREGEWEKCVSTSIHPRSKYRQIALIRLVGIMLIVYIQTEHYGAVRDLSWDTVGTGILGKMGNKGGVVVRLKLYDTTLCFVNCHLAAHQEEVQRRNQDYSEINNRIVFKKSPYKVQDHDQVYWFGDMNYRVNNLSLEQVKKYISMKDYKEILKNDQLQLEHSLKHVLQDYTEGEIHFQPTYKFDLNSNKYDSSEKARTPAWTDRIFYRGKDIREVAYRSHMELSVSDHKPVSALFRSQIAIIDETKQKRVQEEVFKLMDKLENEILPQVTVDQTEVSFGTVKFREHTAQEIIVANTGEVPVCFEFINKINEDQYCKDWLTVTPCRSNIDPGEKCDIKLDIFLEYEENKLEDILVLHLVNGKDIFITVSGVYQRSSFTTSISMLCRAPIPIMHMSQERLKHARNEQSPVLYSIPRELWLLIDYIYRNGIKSRDLFESAALHEEVVQIRDWLDYGSLDSLNGKVSVVAECVLLFLSSTPDPVVPYYLIDKCLMCPNFISCQQVIGSLPDLHRNVFLYVCMFLKELLKYSEDNGTDSKTLASLFGDILLRNPKGKIINPRGKVNFVHQFLVNDLSPLIIPSN